MKYLARTPDGGEMAVGPHSFRQLPPPDYRLRTEEELRTRDALTERSRQLYYNRAEDMDERREHYVELVFEELATKLAQRADATTVIRDAEAALHGAADAAEEPPAAVDCSPPSLRGVSPQSPLRMSPSC